MQGDDTVILTQNPAVREFSLSGVVRALTSPVGGAYLPTRLILHMAEHRLWGLRPMGYRAVNIALNALVCVMLYGTAAHVVPRSVAAVAALLYALHPTHVEAVGWVAGRKDVLSAGLMFAATWLFMARDRARDLPPLVMAFITTLALAAVFAKPTAVVLPGLLLTLKLVAGTLDRRHVRGTVLVGGLFAVAGAAALLHAGIAAAHDVAKPLHGGTVGRNALFAVHAFAAHLRLCVLPVRLSMRYLPREAGLGHAAVALCCLVWLTYTCIQAVRTRHIGVPGFCILWFCISIAPTSTIFFPTSTTIADRYLYVASFGPCLLAAWSMDRVAHRWNRAETRRIAVPLAAISLAVLTVSRCPFWETDGSLWRQAVVDSPNVAGLHTSLAAHYTDQGLYARAQGQIERILGRETALPRAVHNLAVTRYRLGDSEEALRLFQKSIKLLGINSPQAAPCYNGIGLILRDRGDLDGSVHMLGEALRLSPQDPIARSNLASVLATQGKTAEAIRAYEALLADWPDSLSAHFELGKLLYWSGQTEPALRHLLRARQLGCSTAAGEAHVGLCYLKRGDVRAAGLRLRSAMALDEQTWEPHFLAGLIAERMGNVDAAATAYRHALQYGPNATEAEKRLKELEAPRDKPAKPPRVSPGTAPTSTQPGR